MDNDRKDWIRLARKARRVAKQMAQADTRREMLVIAVAYKQLAEWNEHVQPATSPARGRPSTAKTREHSRRQQDAA
jgi:hypothetical protein